MKNFLNKQHELFSAYPFAVLFFVVLLGGVSILLQSYTEDTIITKWLQKHDASQEPPRYTLSVEPRQGLPVPEIVPQQKEDAERISVIDAHAAIVMDVDSGEILYQKNAHELRSIASITKMVTAMIILDRERDLDQYIRVPEHILHMEGSRMGCATTALCEDGPLEEDEELRIRDLLAAMLVKSANDAATLLAEHVAGGEEEFASLMNLRMHELGLTESHFCRPSGLELDDAPESCYSSAHDIARVIAYMRTSDRYSLVWDILLLKEATFTSRDGIIQHRITNTNRLLDTVSYGRGAKTGFTPRAGHSLAFVGQHDQAQQVISIVLDDPYRFDDVQTMTKWAFDNFVW